MKIAFIGSPDHFFTKSFLPELLGYRPEEFLFICVLQNQRKLDVGSPGFLLKWLFLLKHIKFKCYQLATTLFWYFNSLRFSFKILITKELNSKLMMTALKDKDFVLSAGMQKKIKFEILNAPKNGIVNFHYSLLPKFRGTHPVFWQKVEKDFHFGYTFHKMNGQFDTGDIIFQSEVKLDSSKSVSELCDQLTVHASLQLNNVIQSDNVLWPQTNNHLKRYKEKDYWNFIHIDINDSVAAWVHKCAATNLFILNDKFVVRISSKEAKSNSNNKLKINNFKLILLKDGWDFIFDKINYLPAIFYYFQLRKLVG